MGRLSMAESKSEQYHREAAECLDRATRVTDPTIKLKLQNIARSYYRLAEDWRVLERLEPGQ